MGKKRKTYKHTKTRRRHGHTQANKSEHSFTVRVAWPYLSPAHSEMYAGCGGMIYATPASAPLQHSSESEARATYITYLYRPIWQHRTPHSHHIHRPHNDVCGCVWVCVRVGESTLSVTCHRDVLCQCLLHCISKQLQQIWSFVRWKMSPCSQRHTPAVYVFQIYMLCTLDQIQVTMKIFSPALLFCSGKSSYNTTPKFLWAQQGIKESFNKISGEFSWLIVCSCFAITERDTPSAITVSPLWRVEGWDCSVHTPAGCHPERDPWSCLDSLTVWPHHLTKSKQPTGTLLQTSPPPTSPVSPWRSTMQKNHLPQPHINIHMKVWRSLNRTVISLNIRLTESNA